MSFLLRAGLVICTLSYLALREPGRDAAGARHEAETVTAALKGLPAEIRVRASQAAEAEIVRRLTEGSSQDTLSSSDRRPAWRGGAGR